jgi:hypothetical protein
LGQTFVVSNPNKPVSKAILNLVQSVVPAGVDGGKKRTGRWFSFMQ